MIEFTSLENVKDIYNLIIEVEEENPTQGCVPCGSERLWWIVALTSIMGPKYFKKRTQCFVGVDKSWI